MPQTMKKTLLPLFNWPLGIVFSLMLILTLPSCQDQVDSTYTYRTQYPVFMQMSTFREADIIIGPGKQLENPGKIYIYGDFLLINEPQKGIHVIDNTNPSNPIGMNFINIPGNVDLAVNANILYADSYVDLLAFDITNPRDIKKIKRVEDVFEHMYTDLATSTFMTFKDTVMTYESGFMRGWGGGWGAMNDSRAFSSSSGGGESYGQGGSMARFTLMSGHLYAVDETKLRVFDVQTATDPKYLENFQLGWGIETIFPFKGNLFIGSTTGMHIYDASVPSKPKLMSVYAHLTACDPVVVNDQYAFVTLRSGMTCRQGVDQLQVLDITDLYNPQLLKAYPMENPHGLALSGDYLYLAEGNSGLKSFQVADVFKIAENQLEHLRSMKSVDIIPGPKSLIVIGPDGVCQFDYSNPKKLKSLSCIQVKNQIVV
ncbi:LVIVD repeat-containing protein [Rhodonellum ikkaensis]|nr:LVIVD repeat-containing protein [Rhodonellum ikkaensis]